MNSIGSKRVVACLLSLLLVLGAAGGWAEEARFEEIGFVTLGDTLYLTGLLLGASDAGVVVYMHAGEMTGVAAEEAEPDRFVYPVDETGRFFIKAPVVTDGQNRVTSYYELIAVPAGKDAPADSQRETVDAAALTTLLLRSYEGMFFEDVKEWGRQYAEMRGLTLDEEGQPIVATEPPEAEATPEPDATAEETEAPEETAEVEATPEATAAPVETAEPTPEATEAPVETAEPAPEVTEAPVETEEPIPEATEAPEETAAPEETQAPATDGAVPASQDEAVAWSRSVAELSFDAAQAQTPLLFPDVAKTYILERATAFESAGAYNFEVPMPDVSKLRTRDLTDYKSEDPTEYLVTLVRSMEGMIAGLPEQAEPIRGTLEGGANASHRNLEDAFVTLAQELDTWVASGLEKTKAYAAMTRLVLDRSEDAELWKNVDMVDRQQRPTFGKASQRETLKQKSSGDLVRQAQEKLITLGFLEEGGADGKFGKGTAAAVQAYQEANGMDPTGELTVAQQKVLLEEPDPVTLLQDLLVEYDLVDLANTWWDVYLQSLSSVQWQGDTLTFAYPDYSGQQQEILNGIIQGINDGKISADQVGANLIDQITHPGEGTPMVEVTVQISLAAFLEEGELGAILPEESKQALMESFQSFTGPVSAVMEGAVSYAQEGAVAEE